MTKEMVKKQNGALAAAQALKGNLARVKTSIPEVQTSKFLRFLTDGDWVFGQENAQIDAKDRVAINPLSIKTGFTCWTDRPRGAGKNENMGEVMVPLGADPLSARDLPVHRDPKNGNEVCEWKEQISVDVALLSGKHKGAQVLYKSSSMGGTQALGNLIDQIMLQIDEDPAYIVPIVELGSDHYTHTRYGKTYVPVLKIIDWTTLDDDDLGDATDREDDTGETPDDEGPDPDVNVPDEEIEDAEEVPAVEEPVRRRRRRT